MVNKNYQKGVRKEYKIKHELEAQGYKVLRTAGSHGFADLIAIDGEARKIRFIQCKPDNISKAAEEKLLKESEQFISRVFLVDFEVI